MIFDRLTPPHRVHVSNSHSKFGWILSNGLGGDSITEGRTDGRTDGRRRLKYPLRFFKKRGDNIKL